MFAALALLLASLGVFAVVAHTMSLRTRAREIGIRSAMGATPRDVVGLVFRQGIWPVGFGLLIGLTGALAVMPVLRSQLIQVSAADPLALFGAVVVLVLSAGVACAVPARRALRVNPVIALRAD